MSKYNNLGEELYHGQKIGESSEDGDGLTIPVVRKTSRIAGNNHSSSGKTSPHNPEDTNNLVTESLASVYACLENESSEMVQGESLEEDVDAEALMEEEQDKIRKAICISKDIDDVYDLMESENLESALRNNDELNNDEASGVDMLDETIRFNAFSGLEGTEEKEILVAASDEYVSSVKREMIARANQELGALLPYTLAQNVIEENKLCYLDTFESGAALSIFNGKYWAHLPDNELKQLAYDSLTEDLKITTKGIETLVTNIANYVKREIRMQYDNGKKRFSEKDYTDIENRIVFQNCVYDVLTGKRKKFSSRKPYYYAINAEYIEEDIDTPNYDKFKKDATCDNQDSMDMFDYMQAYLVTPNRKGKCFFIMTYARDSGKTIFGEFIEGYFEPHRVSKMDTEHLGGKFSYAGFDQALLVSCLEMPVTRLTASAAKAIKNFTGERRIEIEAKYQNHITAPVRFKTLLASNGGLYLPPGEMDEAFYRRAIVIPFVYSTPLNELIADLPQRWENERSAIISKCVRKLGKILSDDGGLVFPESVQSKEIKANWTGESLVNERFVQNAIQFTARPDDAIPKDDLISIYEEYYSENTYKGKKDRPIHYNKKELVAAIREIYPQVQEKRLRRSSLMYPENTKNVHCLTGIKWSEEMSELIQEAKHKIKDTRRYDEEYEFDCD